MCTVRQSTPHMSTRSLTSPPAQAAAAAAEPDTRCSQPQAPHTVHMHSHAVACAARHVCRQAQPESTAVTSAQRPPAPPTKLIAAQADAHCALPAPLFVLCRRVTTDTDILPYATSSCALRNPGLLASRPHLALCQRQQPCAFERVPVCAHACGLTGCWCRAARVARRPPARTHPLPTWTGRTPVAGEHARGREGA